MQESYKQEVMWPKLVAKKLFRLPLGSHRFVADFPSTDNLVEDASSDRPPHDQRGIHEYRMFASTWNVGGVQPSEDLNLDDWLDTSNSYDIYVLGFQEIVPLKAKNILGPEKSRIPTKWNSLIRATLNRSISDPKASQEPKLGEKQKVHPFKNDNSTGSISREYRCVVSKHMVGIFISVWIRSDLTQYIRNTSVSCIGCGIMGCLGNKGAVLVRFCLHGTSFCFVCCHLASGGKVGDEVHRNSDAMEIFSGTISFPRGPDSLDLPVKILDHDRIIMLGDLNYRISLPEETTRSLVEQMEWNKLLEKDQLLAEVSESRTFQGWQEGAITFSPTYKYYPNSNQYYGCLQGKKGEKRRAPAWCDRIIWYGKGLKQNRYDRCETILSDHRPVRAIFTVEVEENRDIVSPASFLLSDTLNRIESQFDLLEDNGLSSGKSNSEVSPP